MAVKKAKTKNAPGAITKIVIGSKENGKGTENAVPDPKISLTKPIQVRAKVNPRPIPIPSIIERSGGFLEAKASALPKIIQLTTLSGI